MQEVPDLIEALTFFLSSPHTLWPHYYCHNSVAELLLWFPLVRNHSCHPTVSCLETKAQIHHNGIKNKEGPSDIFSLYTSTLMLFNFPHSLPIFSFSNQGDLAVGHGDCLPTLDPYLSSPDRTTSHQGTTQGPGIRRGLLAFKGFCMWHPLLCT